VPKETKPKGDYRIPSVCFVCGADFFGRYNLGDRAKVCTPPTHVCKRKTLKIPGRRDKLITCVDGCCRSKYSKGSTVSSSNAAIDSRKYLGADEYRKVLAATRKLEDPAGITIRFILETGCRCGEALLVRRQYIDWKESNFSSIRMPTLKKSGHPLLPVDLDNKSDLAKELRIWSKKFQPNDMLFQIPKRTLQSIFERILDKVKPDRFGLIHILRHTRASRLIEAGADWNYVRSQLRWSSIELAKIYVHTTEAAVANTFEKLRK
jgi:integrase